jgi:Holliday junction resolvase
MSFTREYTRMTAKRVDTNQKEIVKRFREYGLSVLIMSSLGKGAPDIAVGSSGMTFFFEIKDGSKCFSAQKLTPKEVEFMQAWKGHYSIIRSIEDVDSFVVKLKNKLKFNVDSL